MIRLLLSLIAVAAAVAAAVFLADRPGTVAMTWQGWRIETSVAVLAVALLTAVLALWLLASLAAWLIRTPGRLGRRRRDWRRLEGYRVLTDGLVAIAAGDTAAAERHRRRAERHFARSRHPTPPLTRLLAAQTALLKGDDKAAGAHFTAMLDRPETEFLGLRGLIVQALKAGDDATALRLTERADRLRPATSWVLQSRLALETRAGDWAGAQATLRQAVKGKAIGRAEGRRHRIALLLAEAEAAAKAGRPAEALRHAAKAHGLELGFAPAALRYAALLGGAARPGKALRSLETAWVRGGHGAVIAGYAALIGDAAPAARLRRLDALVGRRDEPAARLAAAEAALAGQLWGEARRHLEVAGGAAAGPWPARLCRLMAEIEEGEHGDRETARLWRDRALRAPTEPAWVCAACTAAAAEWTPLCPSCHGFDTLAWGLPEARPPAEPAAGRAALPVLPQGGEVLDLAPPEPRAAGTPPGSAAAASGAAAETAARGGGA